MCYIYMKKNYFNRFFVLTNHFVYKLLSLKYTFYAIMSAIYSRTNLNELGEILDLSLNFFFLILFYYKAGLNTHTSGRKFVNRLLFWINFKLTLRK